MLYADHQSCTEDVCVTYTVHRQLAEMHQHLLRKFERESKAMKRLSMNNEQLMWKLSQSDIGPLDDDDDDDDRATASRESAAGGMFMSATLPSRAAADRRSAAAGAAMSRSYDGARAMFGGGARPRVDRPTSTKQRHETTSAAVKTDPERAPASTPDCAASRLQRSGTYDVVDK